ncbi:LacI family DNA-binding transcriptional regulator [Isoptericola sp. F-RaC21]|uniref:LacI family DNA-binding transcriptional regulator n=1 Tax=Isoptericola sp. F-RaC21 TaxID=3141452 RepID=UPI00315C2A14
MAEAAGVSMSTASKAINGRGRISAATRRRILDSARELGFVASSGPGRQPVTSVGVLAADLESRFSLPILDGLEDGLSSSSSFVHLCNARGDRLRERHQLNALLDRRVDGLIVVGGRTEERDPVGEDLPVPVVYVHSRSRDPRDTSLVVDDAQGGRLQIEHLAALGRTRVAHISGRPQYRVAADRKVGLAEAAETLGVQLVAELADGPRTALWGRSAMLRILESHGRDAVDAVVCDSDAIALGVIDRLRRESVRVPEDVAVVGYENFGPLVWNSDPAITSVDMLLEEMGREAARLLHGALAGGGLEPGVVAMPCELVPRGSTTRGL